MNKRLFIRMEFTITLVYHWKLHQLMLRGFHRLGYSLLCNHCRTACFHMKIYILNEIIKKLNFWNNHIKVKYISKLSFITSEQNVNYQTIWIDKWYFVYELNIFRFQNIEIKRTWYFSQFQWSVTIVVFNIKARFTFDQ